MGKLIDLAQWLAGRSGKSQCAGERIVASCGCTLCSPRAVENDEPFLDTDGTVVMDTATLVFCERHGWKPIRSRLA